MTNSLNISNQTFFSLKWIDSHASINNQTHDKCLLLVFKNENKRTNRIILEKE